MKLEDLFPNLAADGYLITSPESNAYNCIAWAAGDANDWWWPDSRRLRYWPDDVPRNESLEAFVEMFARLGYSVCPSAQSEVGYEKAAIYCLNGLPQHAARQISSGLWTSKLGNAVDIQYSLHGLEDSLYGAATVFLRRPLETD